MNIEFWFDPACPFCWMTSRWVEEVAPSRDLEVDWRPISLLVKNDPPADSDFYPRLTRTHALLRVVEAAREAGQADRIGALYGRMGRLIHHEDQLDFDVADVLDEVGLDRSLAGALDDESFDEAIRSSMDDALALVGEDVGTPATRRPGSGTGSWPWPRRPGSSS